MKVPKGRNGNQRNFGQLGENNESYPIPKPYNIPNNRKEGYKFLEKTTYPR